MTRLIGLDIGTVRTGIAVSDELGITARPLETVPTEHLADRLQELVTKHQIETIVVGRPRSLDGSLGQQVDVTENIVAQLEASIDVAFVYEDETGTTAESADDAGAACVMLQGFLAEQS